MNSIRNFFFKPKQPVPVPVPAVLEKSSTCDSPLDGFPVKKGESRRGNPKTGFSAVSTTQQPYELILLDTQLESASEDHAKWATKYYLQLILDGLPSTTAAKQTSFKFFGSYQSE